MLYTKAMTTNILMNRLLALLACIAVIAVATCGIDAGMHTNKSGAMPACPFMMGTTALCGADASGRVMTWQNLFTATPAEAYATIFLVIVALFGSILGKNKIEEKRYLWDRGRLFRKVFDPLAQLFSDGVLNAKLYAGA